MLCNKRYSIYFAIELSLREIFLAVHMQMTRKSCAVGMRNAILRNHLNNTQLYEEMDKDIFPLTQD